MRPDSGVPTSPVTGVPGWLTDPEEEVLSRYASLVPEGGRIVEIGAEYGRSAAALLTGSGESVHVLSVDIFPKDHPVVGDLYEAYCDNLDEAGLFIQRLSAVRTTSAEAAEHWDDSPESFVYSELAIDLLFVDGDHSYEAVKQDITAWQRWLRVGGVLLVHDVWSGPDSHPIHAEVLKALDELMDPAVWKLLEQVNSLRAYRRLA